MGHMSGCDLALFSLLLSLLAYEVSHSGVKHSEETDDVAKLSPATQSY